MKKKKKKSSELSNVLFSVFVAACLSSLFFAPKGGSVRNRLFKKEN